MNAFDYFFEFKYIVMVIIWFILINYMIYKFAILTVQSAIQLLFY